MIEKSDREEQKVILQCLQETVLEVATRLRNSPTTTNIRPTNSEIADSLLFRTGLAIGTCLKLQRQIDACIRG